MKTPLHRFLKKTRASQMSGRHLKPVLRITSEANGSTPRAIKTFTKRLFSKNTSDTTRLGALAAQPAAVRNSECLPSGTDVSIASDAAGPTPNLDTSPIPILTQEKPKKFVKTKKILGKVFSVFHFGVQGVAAASDAFPPAKPAVGGLLFIMDAVQKVQDEKAENKQLLKAIEDIGGILEEVTMPEADFPKELQGAAVTLDGALVKAADDLSVELRKGFFSRLAFLQVRSGLSRRVRKEIKAAVRNYKLRLLAHCATRPSVMHVCRASVHTNADNGHHMSTALPTLNKYAIAEANAMFASLLVVNGHRR